MEGNTSSRSTNPQILSSVRTVHSLSQEIASVVRGFPAETSFPKNGALIKLMNSKCSVWLS